MKYSYFPGCSLKSGGRAFEESFLAVAGALGIELEELDDWNCCGATAYMSVDEVQGAALATRNLALADKTGKPLAVPCAGCYGVLRKAAAMQAKYPAVKLEVGLGLRAAGLEYTGASKVTHPLEILAIDLGPKAIRSKVKNPLKGLKVGCYYGCRLVRPEAPFDNASDPQTMETLLKAVGARLPDYPLKTKCCGGSLTGTLSEVGQGLVWQLLREAQRREIDVIATACPLCQFNLECYQDEIRAEHPEIKPMPVVYFTQLLGIAMGLEPQALGLHRQIIPLEPVLREKGILAEKEPAKAGV